MEEIHLPYKAEVDMFYESVVDIIMHYLYMKATIEFFENLRQEYFT